jgi:hypothetical protein
VQYEPDQIYSRRHRAERDYRGLHGTRAAARLAVDSTEFAGNATVIEPNAAERAGYQSGCSADVSETEYGRLQIARQSLRGNRMRAGLGTPHASIT